LKELGCIRPRKSSTRAAIERAADDSRKLRTALWRHLDPGKVGQVDSLTLTVFFHVLLGAVDEEIQCLQNLPADGLPLPPAPHASDDDGNTAGDIPSIFEAVAVDENNVKESVRPDAGSCNLTSTEACGAGEDSNADGRRVIELLMRFDSKQLQTEFQQLYLDRLHFASSLATHAAVKPAQDSRIEMSSTSRGLAERAMQRQRSDAGGGMSSHIDLMLWKHNQKGAKREQYKMRKDASEIESCTFHPSVASRRPNTVTGDAHDRLYAIAQERKDKHEAKVAVREQARLEKEQEICTFKPDLSKSVRSFTKQKPGVPCAVGLRGFEECTHRIRKAFTDQSQVRRVLGERSTPLTNLESADNSKPNSNGNQSSSSVHPLDGPSISARRRNCAVLNDSRHTSPLPRSCCTSIPDPQVQKPSLPGLRPKQSCTCPPPEDKRGGGITPPPATSRRAISADPCIASDDALQPSTGNFWDWKVPEGRSNLVPRLDLPSEDLRPAIVHVEVSLHPGKPSERLVLREGETITDAATAFAVKHHLTPNLLHRLRTLLEDLMAEQEQNLLNDLDN